MLGHEVISFPSRDFVSAAGYKPNVRAFVQIRRRDPDTGRFQVVSRSNGVLPQDDPDTPDFDGIVEVNHPGGGCWLNVTPDIQPGDKIRVFQRDPVTDELISDDTTITANVTTGAPSYALVGGKHLITVKGTAQRMNLNTGAPIAAQIPTAQLEARLINKDRFVTNGRRDLRAPGNGTFKYDVPGSTTNFHWTATFEVKAEDKDRALAAESRVLWLGRRPADGNELTIMEVGPEVVPGPSAPCTAPLEGTVVGPPQAPVAPSADLVPAFTQLLPEPELGHTVIPFPARDFVSAEGYAPGSQVVFDVFRAGALVGQSEPVTVGSDGLAEVNHPGGGCWISSTQTPNIRGGDLVRVTDMSTGVAEETTVANVTANKPRTTAVSGQVVVTGTAAAADGSRIPLAQLEQRLVNPDLFQKNGRRTLRAPGDGTLSYVGTTGNTWRAVYNGLSGTDISRALAAESRILWLGADPAKENQLTIFEIGEGVQNGPEPPCTAPAEAA